MFDEAMVPSSQGSSGSLLIPESESSEGSGLDVRWMTSGNVACSLEPMLSMRAMDVKAQVQEHVGVPMQEQRLFADGQELRGEDVVPDTESAEVALVRTVTDPRMSNLGHFHSVEELEGVPRSALTLVKRIGDGINGTIFKYDYEGKGFVAVKKLWNGVMERARCSEKDERAVHLSRKMLEAEDSLAEIGVLRYLSEQPDVPLYLIKALGIFQDQTFTWLILEFADGGELYDVAASGTAPKEKVRDYVWQAFQGVAYLHQHQIAHRDISLENLLLKAGDVRLIDYGCAVRSHSGAGTPYRFFRSVGKEFYRAPECYVPDVSEVLVCAPVGVALGDVIQVDVGLDDGYLCDVRFTDNAMPGTTCRAEVWGYEVFPADILAVGVCAFILAVGCPPWARARVHDRAFAAARKDGLESLLKSWRKAIQVPDAMDLISKTLQSSPTLRPSVAACLANSWFAPMSGLSVPTHMDMSD